MSKAFVIKNKEGMYKKPHLDIREFYTGNLIEAEMWAEKKDAEYFCPKDCEVAEITIAEGDLEYQNELLKQKVFNLKELLNLVSGENIKTENLHWSELYLLKNRTNEKLKQQLAEKDKQLAIRDEALKNMHEMIKIYVKELFNEEAFSIEHFIQQAKERVK